MWSDTALKGFFCLNVENGVHSADKVIYGLGLSEMQAAARRQLAGSVAAACIIAAVATLAALRPAHHETLQASAHRFAAVHQRAAVAHDSINPLLPPDDAKLLLRTAFVSFTVPDSTLSWLLRLCKGSPKHDRPGPT